MEPECSLPYSQVPATCPYPEPARSSPSPRTSYFLKIHLNIILPSTPGSPKWSLSFRFPHQNLYTPLQNKYSFRNFMVDLSYSAAVALCVFVSMFDNSVNLLSLHVCVSLSHSHTNTGWFKKMDSISYIYIYELSPSIWITLYITGKIHITTHCTCR